MSELTPREAGDSGFAMRNYSLAMVLALVSVIDPGL